MSARMSAGRALTNPIGDDPGKQPGLHRVLMEERILEQAAALFAERGIAGTTLKDVADALGISRPALYYYVKGKDALLERLVESLSQHDARVLAEIRERIDLAPSMKLRLMASELAVNAATHPQQSRILSLSRHQLPAEIAEITLRAERSIMRSLQSVIADGVRSGEFRLVDTRTAALSIVGMCLWTAWWVDGDGSDAVERLAAQIGEQALSSVVSPSRHIDRTSPGALLDNIREDLSQLGRVIDALSLAGVARDGCA